MAHKATLGRRNAYISIRWIFAGTKSHMLVKILDLAYTLMLKFVLGHIGKGTIIEFPVKLDHPSKIWIGDRSRIGRFSWLNCSETEPKAMSLRIGNHAYVGRNCHINAWQDVTLEDFALLSNNVHISDVSHAFEARDVPIALQPPRFIGPVRIGHGAWIGFGAVILPAVSLGRNAVVAALSLVNHNVPDYGVVGGVPAYPIVDLSLNE